MAESDDRRLFDADDRDVVALFVVGLAAFIVAAAAVGFGLGLAVRIFTEVTGWA